MAKERTNITISAETKDRLLQYGAENHIPGGLSGALEHITWHVLKVKGNVSKGQVRIDDK